MKFTVPAFQRTFQKQTLDHVFVRPVMPEEKCIAFYEKSCFFRFPDDVFYFRLKGFPHLFVRINIEYPGPGRLTEVLQGVERWLEEHEYESVEQAKGSMSQRNIADPVAFERANYMKALTSYSTPRQWNSGR